MDFRDSPAEAKFRAEVRSWLAEHAPPYRERFAAAATSKERLDIAAEWQGVMFEAGWGAIGWPEEYGGRPGSRVEQFIVTQETAEVGAPWHLNMGITLGYCAATLLTFGTPEQRDAHLPKMLRGEEIWCQMFSEPNAGSDLASLQTTAVRHDGTYVVNGQKIWSSGAHWARWGILLVRTDPQGPRYRNLSFFICKMDSPGIEIRPITQITGERDFCEVFFTDARLPAAWRVGQEGEGWSIAIFTLLNERIALSGGAGMMVLARQAWSRLVELAKSSGRVEDPRIRQKLAQVYIEGACSRWTSLRALNAFLQGRMPGPEASIVKLTGDAAMQRLQEAASEILGPYGVLTADPAPDRGLWAMGLLSSRAMTIGGGTSEVQRNIVGERVLGLPREPRPG